MSISNTTIRRVLSALILLPIYAYAVLTDQFMSLPILLASIVISSITLFEFYQITDRGEQGRPFIAVGIITNVFVNIVIYLYAMGKLWGFAKYIGDFDGRLIMGVVALFIMTILILQLFTRNIKGGIYSVGITIFGVMFIGFFFAHIILLKSLNYGKYYIFLLNAVIMLNDSGAYFGGVLFGKHKTDFAVSPNKSYEGYFSGLFFSIIGSIIVNEVFISFFKVKLFHMAEAAVVGLLLSLLASVGDLAESTIKRDGEIKDSGSIIPGHGGMFDVFDAILFAQPIFYYYIIVTGG